MISRFAALVLSAVSLALAAPARAQTNFPTKPVRFIVPFPGGGINDVLARVAAEKLQMKWGQPIVVENKTGAGGSIGADAAYQAEPDGYTLFVWHLGRSPSMRASTNSSPTGRRSSFRSPCSARCRM